jgi:ACS family D-galactonate transporter-like MFS transporter
VIGAVSLIGAANYLFIMGKIEPLKVKEPVAAA